VGPMNGLAGPHICASLDCQTARFSYLLPSLAPASTTAASLVPWFRAPTNGNFLAEPGVYLRGAAQTTGEPQLGIWSGGLTRQPWRAGAQTAQLDRPGSRRPWIGPLMGSTSLWPHTATAAACLHIPQRGDAPCAGRPPGPLLAAGSRRARRGTVPAYR